MLFISATTLNIKSGGAQWRDLLFLSRFARGLQRPVPFRILTLRIISALLVSLPLLRAIAIRTFLWRVIS